MGFHYLICSAGAGDVLSDDERKLAETTAELLATKGVRFDAALVSPHGSAPATAKIVLEATGFEGEPVLLKALSPGVPPQVTLRAIFGKGNAVAVFGHETSLASLCGLLVGQASYGAFRRGLVIAVDGREPAWRLEPEKRSIIPLMLERK